MGTHAQSPNQTSKHEIKQTAKLIAKQTRSTGKQAGRQADDTSRQAGRQADSRHAERHTGARASRHANRQTSGQADRPAHRNTQANKPTVVVCMFVCGSGGQAGSRQATSHAVRQQTSRQAGRRQADRAGREHACRQAHRQAGVHCLHDCGCVCVYVFQAGRRNGRRAGVGKEVQQRD